MLDDCEDDDESKLLDRRDEEPQEKRKMKTKDKKEKKMERILGDCEDDGDYAEEQKVVIKKYQEVGKAKEYGERDRWFSQSADQLKIIGCTSQSSKFWLEVLSSVIGGKSGMFLSESFMPVLLETSYNIVYLLAFLDLGFEKPRVLSEKVNKDLVLRSESTFLVVCKRIEEKNTN